MNNFRSVYIGCFLMAGVAIVSCTSPAKTHSDDAAAAKKREIAISEVSSSGPVATQLELFRLHMGHFPIKLRDLIDKPSDIETGQWSGPYANPSSLTDPWGEQFQYTFPGKFRGENNYDLWSKGPDKQDGTEDDITNWVNISNAARGAGKEEKLIR